MTALLRSLDSCCFMSRHRVTSQQRGSWQREEKREGKLAEIREERREAGREKGSWQRKGNGGRFGEEESKGSSWVEERRLGEVLRSVRPI